MRINNNIPALNTNRILNMNTNAIEKSLERLSSGKRINRAADDAAGMAITQKMQAQIRGLKQASRNSLDGISLIQTAEGALNEVHSMLQRMRELCVQGSNGVYADEDLTAIRDEISQLTEQIDKIANDTEFNGIPLLKGDLGKAETILVLQIGPNENQTVEINMGEIKATSEGLGLDAFISGIKGKDPLSSDDFQSGIKVFNEAINIVASQRSKLGAYQNRLEHTIRNIDNTSENLTASMSRIWHWKCLSLQSSMFFNRLEQLCLLKQISFLKVFLNS